jgi:hypothetical protein
MRKYTYISDPGRIQDGRSPVLFVYMFVFSLFNVAVINSDYMTSNIRTLGEEDKEMSGRETFIA